MLNTIKALIADADDEAPEHDVLVTVDAGGGNRWTERGVLELSPHDEVDGVVRLYRRTYLPPARPGQWRVASLTRWPEHEVPTDEGTLTGLTERPTFIRVDRIVTLHHFDQGL